MSGGRAFRLKGNRVERGIVRLLQEHGFAAERVPLSGATRGRFGGDISVPLLGVDRRVEVKAIGGGFRELYKWLTGADILVVRADHREPSLMGLGGSALPVQSAPQLPGSVSTTAASADQTRAALSKFRTVEPLSPGEEIGDDIPYL